METDGTAGQLVALRVVERTGPIALIEHPNGERYYLILCPTCNADISRASLGRTVMTPHGPHVEVFWPVRCPECGAGLLPQPPRIVRAGVAPHPVS